MRIAALLLAVAIVLTGAPSEAQTVGPASPNAEMSRIYDEDQADRTDSVTAIDWDKIAPRDEQRRLATHKLLAAGLLHTGEDYRRAAFIFQHGRTPDDYLLAHTLAMVAASKGSPGALWIASATLDRYLQAIGQPQVLGTQYTIPNASPDVTQEPYNRALVSDALRAELGVPAQARQAEQLEVYRQEQAKRLKR